MPRTLLDLRTNPRWLVLCLLIALLIPITTQQIIRAAATISVNGTTGADTATCGGGSLCKTVGYAVTVRASSGDTIAVAAGTYPETITITKPVTIAGAGQDMTKLDGGNANQVMHINSGVNATIRGVAIQNGNANPGGGIYNAGALTVTDAAVLTNTATTSGGGIFNDGSGTMTIKNVAISGNKAMSGAGIYNDGVTTLDSSTVNGNSAGADKGGGIYNQGTLTISNAVFNNNSAPATGGVGGAIYNTSAGGKVTLTTTTISGNSGYSGGGIGNETSATATVDRSTISGNSATGIGGGIYNRSGGVVSLVNSTLSGNKVTGGAGAGIDTFGATAILTNVTVTGNTSSALGNVGVSTSGPTTLKNSIVADGCSGPVNSGDYNLDAGASCKLNGPHDLSNSNPSLGPLANNGGPTFTHALQAGSPAIDKGGSGSGCPATDQRGVMRPQGAACDIGAFEREQAATQPTATPGGTTSCAALTPGAAFANGGFQTQWQQGEALAANFWGPASTAGLSEPYIEAPGGQRLVQYFDKGRMELTTPATGVVTNGLLANELITGLQQNGDASFQMRAPAAIPIAGDPDNAGPTYAALGGPAGALLNGAPAQTGILVSATVAANGTITPGAATGGSGPTALAIYDSPTQHNVPQAFADYRNVVGLLTIGYAKSEPFLTTVKVGGQPKQVMVQVFERRVLTYTADNPDPFKVEMGNIGQHYYKWRYCTT